ncbi:MAG: cell envelope integrity protein TolA [Xenococcus sp. MO_188.B8]|nr:cell envelope integrity protein TolA [Xenococcus sp. MO_188.B8]
MKIYDKDLFGSRKKREREIRDLEKDFESEEDLIRRLKKTKRSLERAIVNHTITNPVAADEYKEQLKERESEIQEKQNNLQNLENKLKEKKELLNSLNNQKTQEPVQEKLSEEDKKKLQEEDKKKLQEEEKNRQEEEKNREKQKQEYEFVFTRFNEFCEEIQEFNKGQDVQDEIEIPDTPETIQTKLLFKDSDPIANSVKTTLLYVASFFPKLSLRDFEQIVLFLLEKRTVTVKVTSKTTNEKGETQLVETAEEKQLTKIWKDSLGRRDQFLGECYLRAVRSEDSFKTIDFSFLSLRKDVKRCFEEELALYLEEQFKRIRFLLFDSSSRVTINVIDLSVEMAISNPDLYGKYWLCSIIEYLHILELANTLAKEKGSELTSEQWLQILMLELTEEQRNELNLFERFLNPIGQKQRKQFVFLRLSSLISKMLEYSHLQDEVESFLDWAIQNKYQDAVLEIVKPLRSAHNFNQLYWLKQLLDRGNAEIRYKTYLFLSTRLDQSYSQIYNLLQSIKAWLPEPNLPLNRYSPSNEYALRLIFEYSVGKMSEFKTEDYGDLSKYPLFRQLQNNSVDERLQLLVDWIFHPGLKYLIDQDISPIQAIGSLLSDWFTILWGLGKQEPDSENIEIIDNLIGKVIAKTDRNQQRELIQFWNDFTDYLLYDAESYREDNEETLSKLLVKKRNAIRQVKKRFKESQKK